MIKITKLIILRRELGEVFLKINFIGSSKIVNSNGGV